ncbi:MAG: hypothetical protein ACRDK4_09300 [Solirubrobacteraceae bacterium]
MSRQTAMWTLAALLGIVLTAGITWATSQLTSQRIGISSEPISAASRLAPRVIERHTQPAKRKVVVKKPSKAAVHITTAPPVLAPESSTSSTSTSTAQATPELQAQPTPSMRTSKASGEDGSETRSGGNSGQAPGGGISGSEASSAGGGGREGSGRGRDD